MCIPCVLTFHKMRVDSRVFYPTISQQSCHVQHTTCSHNEAGHSMFNIHEFQAVFSTLHCTVSKCILLGKSAYSVHTVCSWIAQNVRWITVVLSNDITAILPCTAHYLLPCVLALHRMCVDSRVFYPTISQRSCHVQHTTCSHDEAGHSMFKIQESQNAFTT